MSARSLSALILPLLAAACGGAAAIEERVIDPSSRAPLLLERVALPDGGKASAAWVSPLGGALVSLRDGRLVAIDDAGKMHVIERAGEGAPREISAFAERAPGVPMALASGGAWRFDRDVARWSEVTPLLDAPRAFAPFGAGALWATRGGLYANDGARWLSLSLGAEPMRDVSTLLPFAGPSAREAWVLDGVTLRHLRMDDAGRVIWIEAAPGVDLGPVRGIAPLGEGRIAVASARGVASIAPDRFVLDRAEEGIAPPEAIAGAGGFAWVGWDGQILRTDGARWESLARGVPLGPGARIAVEESGATALVIDANGDLLRLDADESLRLAGFQTGARVTDTRLDLEALTSRSTLFASVDFALDGRAIARRTAAPWGWGDAGARARDLREIELGAHVVEITATTRRGRVLRRALRFEYASPFGRVPSYARDIAPLFAARCSRCHDSGVARDLATYERLRAQAPMVRASVREARMPPDLLLDPASVALITAWVDGDTPP